jgi:hypothetical protein
MRTIQPSEGKIGGGPQALLLFAVQQIAAAGAHHRHVYKSYMDVVC